MNFFLQARSKQVRPRFHAAGWRGYVCALLTVLMFAQGCASTAPPSPPGAPPGAGGVPGAPGAPGAPAGTPGAATTASAGGSTVNVTTPAQPCCPHLTLWEFLGFKGGFKLLGGLIERIRNRLGSVFPGLEAKPAIVAITDPSMAASSNPAEAAAAGAKADEDAAPQKIKAIRYLATLGCAGCYPNVEDALLAALDDCTESVRYEAAKAIRENSGKPCSTCKTKGCCSPKVLKKLDQIANKVEKGCYVESSARVRREARLGLAGCGNAPPPASTEGPKEGPSEGPGAAPAAGAPVTAGESAVDSAEAAIASLLGVPTAKRASHPTGTITQTRTFGGQASSDCGCGSSQGTITIQTPVAAPAAMAQKPAARFAKAPSSSSAQSPTPAPNSPAVNSPAALPAGSEPSKLRIASPPAISVMRTSGAVLAEVNGQLVFESEVLPEVDRQLSQIGPQMSVEQKLHERPAFIRRELVAVIDRKLICQAAHRAAPEVAQAAFDASQGDEASIAGAWLRGQTRVDDTITQDQLQACYVATQAKYPRPAEVRYEQIVAKLDNFATRDEAQFAIEYARNRALGIRQAAAAGQRLQALQAQTSDWTRRETIDSADVARSLFSMPVGSISAIFTGADGYHVYRVLERRNAGPAPLETVIELVREDVLIQRRAYLEEAYISQLRARARVWTAFDAPPTRSAGH